MFLRKIIPQDKVFFELFRELAVSVREAGRPRCARILDYYDEDTGTARAAGRR